MRNATNERPGQSRPWATSHAGARSTCISSPGTLGRPRPRPVQEVTSTEPTVAEMKEGLWPLCCSRLTQSGSQALTVSWGPARLSPPHCSDSPRPLPPLWLPCPPVSWESQGQAYPGAFSSPGKAPPPQRFSGLLPLHHFLRAIPRTPAGEQHPHHILHPHCPSPAFLPTKALARTARPSLPLMYVHGSTDWSFYVRTSTPRGQGSLSVCLFSSLLWAQNPIAPDTKQTLARSWWNAGEKACVLA